MARVVSLAPRVVGAPMLAPASETRERGIWFTHSRDERAVTWHWIPTPSHRRAFCGERFSKLGDWFMLEKVIGESYCSACGIAFDRWGSQ